MFRFLGCIGLCLLSCVPTLAHAGGMRSVFLGAPFMEGWIPEEAEAIRGVIILNGFPNDGIWDEACAHWSFAILRINTDEYHTKMAQEELGLKNRLS